jgi:hypothetical protein
MLFDKGDTDVQHNPCHDQPRLYCKIPSIKVQSRNQAQKGGRNYFLYLTEKKCTLFPEGKENFRIFLYGK